MTVSVAEDDKFLLAFMRDEVSTELLGVCVDEEAELDEDCDPDIIWPEDESTMVVVCLEHGMHEPVGLWHDVPDCIELGGEGCAEEMTTALKLFRGGLFEYCEVGVLAEGYLKAVVLCERFCGVSGRAK
jgi:hypothetical protein